VYDEEERSPASMKAMKAVKPAAMKAMKAMTAMKTCRASLNMDPRYVASRAYYAARTEALAQGKSGEKAKAAGRRAHVKVMKAHRA
jgi:hypothetical protein